MESKDRLLFEISELLTKAFDKSITGDQFDRLQYLISTDPKALEYYFDIISTYSCLDGIKKSDFGDNAIDQNEQFDLTELAAIGSKVVDSSNVSLCDADARELETLELPRSYPALPREKAVVEKNKLTGLDKSLIKSDRSTGTTRFQNFILATLAACVMIITGLVYIINNQPDLPVVARLTDSMNAVWDDGFQLPDEYDEMIQGRYRLKKGYASILFDDGASVTVEGPAGFSLNSTGDMELFSGRIYAAVPELARGFTVKAGSSKIVDLGTEFGVEMGSDNSAQLHVTKGETLLFSGAKDGKKIQMNVDAGSAKKVYSNGKTKDIDVSSGDFVQKIDSNLGAVLTGPVQVIDSRYIVETQVHGPFDPSTDTDEVFFAGDVSDSDLLTGIVGIHTGWLFAMGGPGRNLNDGRNGADFEGTQETTLSTGAAWARNGASSVFELGIGNGAGYEISGIQSIAAWSTAGFANQKYQVSVKYLGDDEFTDLLTVEYQPFRHSGRHTGRKLIYTGGSTKVNVTGKAGEVASGVVAIKFIVLDTIGDPRGGTVFREIDVFGKAITNYE